MKRFVHLGLKSLLEIVLTAVFILTPVHFERSGLIGSQTVDAFNQDGDEFVGPFASWANVKTQYGAVGNGVADDSAALQNALNDLGQSGKASVLYLPAGAYRITRTLTMATRINVSIIGEDPATTSIVWGGSAGGTMFYINGVAYSRFNRLTWDGKSKAGIAIDQSKADGTSQYFDTGNEYADDTFTDVGIGIRGGFLDYGFAETVILRSHFIRNSQAGISLGNYNALDIFVWNSTFEDCSRGITNEYGAGNFSVYNSIFSGSTFSDIVVAQTSNGAFSVRNNFSSGSRAFFGTYGSNNPANITIQGNTVLDPTSGSAISVANEGPLFVIDNVIRSSVTQYPVFHFTNGVIADLFSIGNTFTVANPLSDTNARVHSIDDQTVSRSSINATVPTLPGTLPNYHRQVFEVPPGASAATIQQIINTAAVQNGSRPVVHLPPSSLAVNATIVIPANTDLQIVGDGAISLLSWTGSGSGPVLRLAGPSKAVLRDFYINGGGLADGIVVENADQPGSRVFMEQPYLNNYQQNLFVNGLDYTNVQLQDFYHSGYGNGTTSVKVVGGPSAAAGNWLGGKTNIFSGNSSSNMLTYEALQGAHLTVRDIWYETGSFFPKFIHLTGNSTFSFSGSHVYLPVSSTSPAIDINNFTGKATFFSSIMFGNLVISGNGSQAKVLGIGLVGPSQNYFFNTASPAAQGLLLNSTTFNSTIPGSGAMQIPEQGLYDPSFIRDMLSQIRTEQPTSLTSLASEATDLRLYRVHVVQALTGIHLIGGVTTSIPPPPSATQTLTVASSNPTSATIAVIPNDNNGQSSGASQLTRTYNNNTAVTLTASATSGGNNFSGWSGCDSSSGVTCNVTMNANKTVTAAYVTPVRSLTVASLNPTSGVSITVSPNDNSSQGSGASQFTRTYNNNAAVTLTAPTTASGNNFSGWSGCDSSSGATCNVTMSSDKSVTAAYMTPVRSLTVASSNPASGVSIAVSPNDNSSQGGGASQFTRTYNNNAAVTLTAPATAGGNNFSGWSGCDSSSGTSCSVTMSSNKTVTAAYVTPVRSLTVASSNPSTGVSITVSPNDNSSQGGGPSQFTRSYNNNAAVTLTAPATASGNNFSGWSGCDSSSATTCNVTMNASKAVTATYVTPQVTQTLTIASSNPASGASVTITPNDNGSQGNGVTQSTRIYNDNTAVTLTAAATAGGNNFSGWSGCDSSAGATCSVTMNSNKTVTAAYVTLVRTLTVASSNPASGVSMTVSPNDNSSQGSGASQFTRTYNNNAAVTLTAPTTASGNNFSGWSGCDSSSGATCNVTMSSDKSVTAAYMTPVRSLTVASSNPASGVSIAVSPNDNSSQGGGASQFTRTYNNNAAVTLTAPATAGGNNFSGWSGCDSSSGTSCSVTMSSNKTVTAAYVTPVRSLTVASSNPSTGVSITVSPNDNSSQGGGPSQFTRSYNNNAAVTLTAPATASGNNFSGWSGCDSSAGATCSVTMSSDKSVTAAYVTPVRSLTVASTNPTSGVSITVIPNDNSSQGSGSAQFTRSYNNNAAVTLTAPDTAGGNNFSSWSGCDSSAGVSCSVTMNSNKTVTAAYVTPIRTLTVASSNPASGVSIAVSPNDNSSQGGGASQFTRTYNNNAAVTLTAPATAGGNNFSSWSGCDSSSATTCNVTMNASKAVTATYVTPQVTRTLTIASSNPANGASVTITPIDNSSQGTGVTQSTRTYNDNTAVTLTAAATAGGNNFSGWSGCDSSAGATCSVTMSSDKSVTAAYVTLTIAPSNPPAPVWTLTVASSNPASGVLMTVNPNDNSSQGSGASQFTRSYNNNAAVTLTAPETAGGNNFSSWSGCDRSSWRKCIANMKADKTVTAVYVTPVRTLTIASGSPSSGVPVTVSPNDNNGNGNGSSQLTRIFNKNTVVALTAPSTSGAHKFSRWSGCDSSTGTVCNVTMSANKTVKAVYR